MKATQFQDYVQERITGDGKPSMLLVAPTGLGKTFAVTGDLQNSFSKTVFAVPLRALGNDIQYSISKYQRHGETIQAVIHHGAVQESELFGEEVIVTTYDQVVCGVPGLPLSLPLKAGHAVAGALLMSRLIFDEAHLAWGISDNALTILLAIVQFRARYGLQTILQTATLPNAVSKLLCAELGLERVLVGEAGEVVEDEALTLRDVNRQVKADILPVGKPKGEKIFDYQPLDNLLTEPGNHNRIYFANTVDRIQQTYDRLLQSGVAAERLMVLHNRMPHKQRTEVEIKVRSNFGENGLPQELILLTNQVAEAGLNISAPLVVSDPAPVDTLVQRAGRCARWFRDGRVEGRFVVLNVPGLKEKNPSEEAKQYVLPYRIPFVAAALQHFPTGKTLSWDEERRWVDKAWGGGEDKARIAVEKALNDTAFALNLFDRAAQERQPGQIASVFREILSVEVAVENVNRVTIFIDDVSTAPRDLPLLLSEGQLPDTSSISLGKAISLVKEAGGSAAIIRYEDELKHRKLRSGDSIQVGDVLILPSTMAYLHPIKGLCFGDGNLVADAILESKWCFPDKATKEYQKGEGRRQTLAEHTRNVMNRAYEKLTDESSPYNTTLTKILSTLEQPSDVKQLVQLVVQIACVAIAFHDLGKADIEWQRRVRKLDPDCPPGLVGRSLSTGQRIGRPHTPPGYAATVEACQLLLGGKLGNAASLVQAIALASCRHHSSLFNPATVQNYSFTPHPEAMEFVRIMLGEVSAPPAAIAQASTILVAAQKLPAAKVVPLMLPNHDLFALYALVGRAILLADREDAAGKFLETLS